MHHDPSGAPLDVASQWVPPRCVHGDRPCHADAVDKAVLRQHVRQQRAAGLHRSAGERIAVGLNELRSAFGAAAPGLLAGYLPARGEPDVRACLEQSWHRGERVIVPRTLPGCRMEWVAWSPTAALQPDRHGLLTPAGPPMAGGLASAPEHAALLLIPALAADRTGMRLGHGAGYYDRALAGLPRWPAGPLRVAVVHPEEMLAEPLPREPHDEFVDAVLTAAGWSRTEAA